LLVSLKNSRCFAQLSMTESTFSAARADLKVGATAFFRSLLLKA
jgi:hypothetical protein